MKSIYALVLVFLAAGVFAQTAEYGQASAGALDMTAKRSAPFSGSLAFSSARGQGLGLGGTFGGTLVKDRVWFFASGEKSRSVVNTALPMRTTDLNASFATTPRSLTVPSSFLSLHSTSILSSNSFFTFDVSQSRR